MVPFIVAVCFIPVALGSLFLACYFPSDFADKFEKNGVTIVALRDGGDHGNFNLQFYRVGKILPGMVWFEFLTTWPDYNVPFVEQAADGSVVIHKFSGQKVIVPKRLRS